MDDRYHLHQQLEGAIDERGAATMMELLPPVGWADVATKRDLDQLEQRMDLRFDASTSKLRAEIAESGRKMQGLLLTAIVAATSILAALSVYSPS